MKLTLGQAAKEVGISKPSLSAAIKKGRVSAQKNESGVYEIDPAELFRAYPRKKEANESANSEDLPETNPRKAVSVNSKDNTLDLLLGERDKLLEEKEKAIRRLEQEKSELREDLQEQREQAKRVTLLLENKSSGVGEFERTFSELEKKLEERFSKQEKEQEEQRQKAHKEKRDLEKSVGVYKTTFFAIILIFLVALSVIYGKVYL